MSSIEIDQSILALIDRAIEEDLASEGDVTSLATIEAGSKSRANFVAKSEGVIAGLQVAEAVMRRVGVESFEARIADGDLVKAGTIIASVEGDTAKVLLGERSALNFISRLSGIATLTRKWVDAISGTKAQIRDTRKTTPGLRTLEKYAVRVGGGTNHRSNLSESALIKDNHIAAAGSISRAFLAVRERFPLIEVEVEVDSLEQLREVIEAGATLVLLDNMDLEMTREAVRIANGRVKLESSGGLRLDTARDYAESGVDYLAVGALTHSAPILDISLDFLGAKEQD